MFFTREDILKIQQALLQLGVKDSELSNAEPVTYSDILSIVQDGKNKQIKIKDFFNQISLWKREDFINITDKYNVHYILLKEAINLIPILQRKDGLVITFQDTNGDWRIYQFRGNIMNFLIESNWIDVLKIKENTIGTEEIKDKAITTSKITPRSITAEKIAKDSISRVELNSDVRISIDKKADAEQVNNSLRNLEEKIGNRFVVEGNVTNLPDEEDLVSVNKNGQDVLKFADKAYAPESFSGKGYVILRKNLQPVKFKTASINVNSVGTTKGNISFKIMNRTFNVSFDPTIENTTTLLANKIAKSLADSVYDFDISSRDNQVFLVCTIIYDIPDIVFIPNDTGVEATVLMSEKTEIRNVLTQNMVSKPNTTYEVRYDFDIVSTIWVGNLKFIGNGGSINFNRHVLGSTKLVLFENLKLINRGGQYESEGIASILSKNCIFENKGLLGIQAFCSVDINIEEYIMKAKTAAMFSKICINLNEIIENIQSNHIIFGGNNVIVTFPNTEGGYFYVERPIIIKTGFKYNFNGITIYSTENYDYDHIIEYESINNSNNVKGEIKNVLIDVSNTKKNLKTVFDLTNFNGTLDHVQVWLGNNTAFAFLQPIGTYYKGYSDMKRITKSVVLSNYNEEVGLLPRTVFCAGDGCIIEQSNLGGVLIFRGQSYTITGCLNDNYYLLNTSVNFESCYWEIGQFRIINSNVNFRGCQMHFDNHLPQKNRHFKGSLFSIDTEEAKNDIFLALNKGLGLTQLRFNLYNYSTVGFYNNTLFEIIYWYLSNKNSGKIMSIGKNTIIKNIDELIYRSTYNAEDTTVREYKFIINDVDFQYDLQRKSIDFSTVSFTASNLVPKNLPVTTNFSWSNSVNIKVDFYYVISEKKKIFKKVATSTGVTKTGTSSISTNITSNFIANEDRFICAIMINNEKYFSKIHVYKNTVISILYKDTWDENIYRNVNLSVYLNFIEIEPGKYKCNEIECIKDAALYDMLTSNKYNECNKCIVNENFIFPYFNTLPSYGEWEYGDICIVGNVTYTFDGNKWNMISNLKGLSSERPSLQSTEEGFEYYDSTLKKKILWNGTAWVNLDGTELL